MIGSKVAHHGAVFLAFACMMFIGRLPAEGERGNVLNVMDYGAVSDGETLTSKAIQEAIDACSAAGGGEVIVPKGSYLCGTILVKNNVILRLEKGAVLLGSTKLEDYSNPDFFVDAVGQERGWCLIGLVDAENAGIVGEGMINGRGSREHFQSRRPFLVRCVASRNIRFEGIKLRDSAAWCLHLFQSKGVKILQVHIDNHVNANNDGIDIDSTQDVLIDGCIIDSGDDAVCIKATSPVATRNVVIANCVLTSHWGAFKMGTESMGDFKNITFRDSVIQDTRGGAMKILSMDGCRLENLKIDNIKITNTDMTLFMRLGSRLNTYREKEARSPGFIKNVSISNIISDTSPEGRLAAPTGIIITGEKTDEKTHHIKNVTIKDVQITVEGKGRAEAVPAILERSRRNNYPEYHLFWPKDSEKRQWPAYGIYARHVENLNLENVEVMTRHADTRPFVHLEDAHDVTLDVRTHEGNGTFLFKKDSTDVVIEQRAARKVRKKPNVILMFSDDQRYNTIRALGNAEIHTPNLDRLCDEGTSFTRTYMMGSQSAATCIPSRAMLLSGRSLFRLEKKGRSIPENHMTIPEALKRNGYYTYWVGKSHQTASTMGRMFDGGDRCYGYHHGSGRFKFRDYNHYLMAVQDFDPKGRFDGPHYIYKRGAQGDEVKTKVDEELFTKLKAVKDKEADLFHTSEVFSTGAINFLNGYERGQPFFMYLAYHAPHDPRNAPKRIRDMYPPEKIKLPASFMKGHPFDQGALRIRDEKLAGLPRDESEIRQNIAAYYSIITHMDEQIGRVLAALKETGLEEETIVIFTSDSGLAVGNHGLMGKQNLYDAGGIHVPLIFRGPGIPKGESRDALCYLFDLMPTLCDMTGSAIPTSCEGKSLIGVLNGLGENPYDYQYFAYGKSQRAVQDERYKLIEYSHKGKRFTQLFDLKEDMDEVHNLVDDENQRERITALRNMMKRLAKEYGDPIDIGQWFK